MKVLKDFEYYSDGSRKMERVRTLHEKELKKEVDDEHYYYNQQGQLVRYTYENSENELAKYEEKYEKFNADDMPTVVHYKGFNSSGKKVEYKKVIEYDEMGSEKTITYYSKWGRLMKKIEVSEEENAAFENDDDDLFASDEKEE